MTVKTEGNKISGTCICIYPGGYTTKKTLSGKFYKKMNGCYIEETEWVKEKVTGTVVGIFLDKYSFDFSICNSNELNCDVECIRMANFSATSGCHPKYEMRFTRK